MCIQNFINFYCIPLNFAKQYIHGLNVSAINRKTLHSLILTSHIHTYTNPASLSTPVLGLLGQPREPLFHRTGPVHSVLFQSGETKCVDLADFFSLSASDVDFSSDCERNASQRRLPRQPRLGSIQMHSSFWTLARSAKRPPSGKIQGADCSGCIIDHPCTSVHHHSIFVFCFSGMRARFAFLFLLAATFALSVGWKRIFFDRNFVGHFYIFTFTFFFCHSWLQKHPSIINICFQVKSKPHGKHHRLHKASHFAKEKVRLSRKNPKFYFEQMISCRPLRISLFS